MKYIKIILAILLLSLQVCSAQQAGKSSKAVSVTFGGPIPLATAVVSFETFRPESKFGFKASAGAVKGVYYNSDDDTPGALFVAGDMVFLSNPDGRGFDLSAGLGLSFYQINSNKHTYYPDAWDRWPLFTPRINLNYRWYLGDKVFIKAGLGYPELTNFSVGYRW